MQFGRVQGYVREAGSGDAGRLHLTVTLEANRTIKVVREETLAPLRALATFEDWVWHADQWTQETVGVDLAEQGWEVVGAGPVPEGDEGLPASSAVYAVRKLS